VPIFLPFRLSRASMNSKRILHTMCASPLMGMDRKECYRLTHPLPKISGYATGYIVCALRLLNTVSQMKCLRPYAHGRKDARKHVRTYAQTNEQPQNILFPAPGIARVRHKRNKIETDKLASHVIGLKSITYDTGTGRYTLRSKGQG